MNNNTATTIFQNSEQFSRVKMLFLLFFIKGFTVYSQLSLQGNVVIIGEEHLNKETFHLYVSQGTYIYNQSENKQKAKSKIIAKSSEHKGFKERNTAKIKHYKSESSEYYTHTQSELFFNPSVSISSACNGNNYQVKKDAVLAKNELFKVFYFSKDTKSFPLYHLKTQYDYSKKHSIRPPPSFI